MTEFAAKIGKIRMKAGGAEIRLLRNPGAPDDDVDWRGCMVRNAKDIAETADDRPLVGYLVLGIREDGSYQAGFRIDYDACPIPRMFIPTWIAELLRRDLIIEPSAERKFHEIFEWQEGPTG